MTIGEVGGRALLCGLVVAFAAVPVQGGPAPASANRISNGEFDDSVGVAGWTTLTPSIGALQPDTEDFDLCPASGSMRLSNADLETPSANAVFVFCTSNVTAGEVLRLGARFRFPAGTPASSATAVVYWYEEAVCSGFILDIQSTNTVLSGDANWHEAVSSALTVPATTHGALIRIHLVKSLEESPVVQVLVDRVRLAPQALLFAEDFEVGDPCRWSN